MRFIFSNRKQRLGLFLVVLAMLSMGTFVGLAAQPVTIKVMRPGYPKEARTFFAEVQQALAKEYPNIKLEVIDADWNTFHSRISIWATGKQEPDVYLCSPTDLALLVDLKALMPLDSIIDSKLKEDIPKGAWESVKYKGRLYSIPGGHAPFVLWYNKEIFKKAGLDPLKPPKTWDELLTYCQQIKANTDVAPLGIGLGRSLDFTQLVWGMLFFSATNQSFIDSRGRATITSLNSIKAHQFLVDLIKKYQVSQPNPELYGKGDIRLLFRDEKVAMCVDGPWLINIVQSTTDLSSPEKSKFAVARAPSSGIKGKKPMFASSTDSWVISANTKHPKEAQQVLKFLVRPEWQYAHDKAVNQMPFRKSLYADVQKYPLTNNWIYRAMFEMMDDTISFQPIIPTASAVFDTMKNAIIKMITGIMPVEDALKEAATAIAQMNKTK